MTHTNENNNDSIFNYSNVESIESTSYSMVATAAKHKLNDCFKHLRRHHWSHLSHRRRNHQNSNSVEMGLLKRWSEACVAFIRKQSTTQPLLLNESEKIAAKASTYKKKCQINFKKNCFFKGNTNTRATTSFKEA